MVPTRIGQPLNRAAAELGALTTSERETLFVPAGLGLLAVIAVFLGRGLAAALPGAVVGLDAVVNLVLTFGAFTSQLFAIAGATVSLRLALWLSTHRGLHWGVKGWLGTTSLFVCLVVFFAAQPRLFIVGPLVLGLLSFASGGLLILSGQLSMRFSETRTISRLATLAGFTTLFHTGARLVALDASSTGDGIQFDVARAVATFGATLDLVFVVGAAVWLWFNTRATTRAWGSVVLACLPALFVGSPASGPRYVAQRTADAMTSHPDPFLPLFVQWGLECGALTLAALCVLERSQARSARLAVAFALLGRTTSDRPLGALLLLLSALCLLFPLLTRPISVPDETRGHGIPNSPGPLSI